MPKYDTCHIKELLVNLLDVEISSTSWQYNTFAMDNDQFDSEDLTDEFEISRT